MHCISINIVLVRASDAPIIHERSPGLNSFADLEPYGDTELICEYTLLLFSILYVRFDSAAHITDSQLRTRRLW